jgi:hypothetical protein
MAAEAGMACPSVVSGLVINPYMIVAINNYYYLASSLWKTVDVLERFRMGLQTGRSLHATACASAPASQLGSSMPWFAPPSY